MENLVEYEPSTPDTVTFVESLESVAEQIQANSFQFANEPPFAAEVHHQLRTRLDDQYRQVRIDTAYPQRRVQYGRDTGFEPGIKRFHWWMREQYGESSLPDRPEVKDGDMHFTGDSDQEILRTRTEVSFVRDGFPIEYTDDGTLLSPPEWEEKYIEPVTQERRTPSPSPATYDFAVFPRTSEASGPILQQSKYEGFGEYFDTQNRLSVLSELKHSKNYRNSSFASGWEDDLYRLANYPGEVDLRAFVFMDVWPRRTWATDGNPRVTEFFTKAKDALGESPPDESIVIFYLPREEPPDLVQRDVAKPLIAKKVS
jgi:hypothetical protein